MVTKIRRWLTLALAALLIALAGCVTQPSPTQETIPTATVEASYTPEPSAEPSATVPLYLYEALAAERDYVKLSEMEYERPLIENAQSLTDVFFEAFHSAPDGRTQIEAYVEYSTAIAKMNDMYVLALISFYRNVSEDTQAEQDFCEDFQADFSELQNEVYQTILTSEYIENWETYLGEDLMKQLRIAVEMFDDRMVEIYRQIFKLRNEYTRIVTDFETKTAIYEGVELTTDQMVAQILYDAVVFPERAQAIDALLLDHMDGLNVKCNDIYEQMLGLRTQAASIAGFDNYFEYALSEGSYDAATIKRFVKDVRETMIPVMMDIRDRAEEILGEPLGAANYTLAMFAPIYASEYVFEDPTDSTEQAEQKRYDAAMELLRGLLPELNDLVDYLEKYEMIDVFSREGKSSGGFSVMFPYLQQPFIFSQRMNVSTVIHEAGHALNSYSYPAIDIQERFSGGSEINEVHSMGLEMLALESYELLYGDTADIAELAKIYDGLSAILSQTMYYEFEMTLYEQPDMTRDERNELFSRLLKEYGQEIPGISIYDSYGGNWVGISHMFEQPLYTIDYSLAQLVSFEIYELSLEDFDGAKDIYMLYMYDNQSLDLRKRLGNAGLGDPFDRTSMESIAAMIKEALLSDAYWEPLESYSRQMQPAA